MCYFFKQSKSAEVIKKRFNITDVPSQIPFSDKKINGFDFPVLATISNQSTEKITPMHWGLIPHWSKNEDIRNHTLNARIETLHETASFKDVLHQRCLILADSFFEWQWLDSKGKNKIPFEIGVRDQELFAMAGIFSLWQNPNTGKMINSCSILTTQANALMSEIHNTKKRMPVILKPNDENTWLTGQNIMDFAFPYQTDLVAKNINPQYSLFG